MGKRSSLAKKAAPETTVTPLLTNLLARPFAPTAPPVAESTLPDLQAQLEHAQRYGHSLATYSPTQTQPAPLPLQPKLTIGASGDKYEQEADRVAQQVVKRLPATKVEGSKCDSAVQRETMPEDDELQMSPEGTSQRLDHSKTQMPMLQLRADQGSTTATPALEASIEQSRGGGQALPAQIRAPLEHAFGGVDFSGVKVHTNTQSDQLNRTLQSTAFTTKQDIFFRQGAYEPGSRGGQELLAHELTHVVQQSHSGTIGAVQRRLAADAPINAAAAAQVTSITNPHGHVFILEDGNTHESVVVKMEQVQAESEGLASFEARYQLGEEIGAAVFGTDWIAKNTVTPAEISQLQTLGNIAPAGAALARVTSDAKILAEHYVIKMPKLNLGQNLFELSFGNRPTYGGGKQKQNNPHSGQDTQLIQNLILNNGKNMGMMAYYDALVRNTDRFNVSNATVEIKNIDFDSTNTTTVPLDNIFNGKFLIGDQSSQQTAEMLKVVQGNRRTLAMKLIEAMWPMAFYGHTTTVPSPNKLGMRYVQWLKNMEDGMAAAERAVEPLVNQWEIDLNAPMRGQHRNPQDMETKRVLVSRYKAGKGLPPARPTGPIPR